MGANLNRLMQSYGVYTPTMSPYSGVDTPDALKAGATAGERGTYQGSLADYAAQQDAFKGYERDYRNRIATTDLYTNPGPASTFLSTPNYSGIRGMRANLSDTTSADTTDYTNPNFDSMINDAYRSLGRVGIGTDTSNIDQAGYDYWKGQLQAGAIAPRDFKNQFKIKTNADIREKPDDDYTKYIQGYLGILPATTLPVLPTPGGDTTPGPGGDTGMGGEGPASPKGSVSDQLDSAGDAKDTAGDLRGTLASIGDWFGGLFGGSAGAAQGAAQDASSGYMYARGGPVNSPTSMEEALLNDRSRHEFSDPRFEELYGKYFYASGGGVEERRRAAGEPQLRSLVLPQPVVGFPDNNPGNVQDVGGLVSGVRDGIGALINFPGLLPEFFGRGPAIAPPQVLDSSAAERGASLGSSGDFSLSAGDPDALMSLEDQRGNLPRDTGTVAPNAPEVAIGQGPAGRVPAPATATPTYDAQRDDLFRRYLGPQPASPEMLAARQTAREAQANFVKMLNDQSSGETGPSEAEKYFRLASAFLSPTKTGKGAFGESVALASRELADFEKSTTNSKNAAQAAKLQRMLKANEITWQVAKEELASIRAQEEGSRKDTLAIKLEELRDRRDQNDPKTELHRQLIGMGLVRGTDEYKKEYDRRTALADEAAALKQAQAVLNYNSLNSTEQKNLFATQSGLTGSREARKKLREALDINDQTLAIGSFFGRTENDIKRQLGSTDPLVVNSARQAILLSLVALGKLKSTFPGAISDKESAIMLKLQGLNAASLTERRDILASALLDLEELEKAQEEHISDIKARKFRTYDPQSPSAGAAP